MTTKTEATTTATAKAKAKANAKAKAKAKAVPSALSGSVREPGKGIGEEALLEDRVEVGDAVVQDFGGA